MINYQKCQPCPSTLDKRSNGCWILNHVINVSALFDCIVLIPVPHCVWHTKSSVVILEVGITLPGSVQSATNLVNSIILLTMRSTWASCRYLGGQCMMHPKSLGISYCYGYKNLTAMPTLPVPNTGLSTRGFAFLHTCIACVWFQLHWGLHQFLRQDQIDFCTYVFLQGIKIVSGKLVWKC